VSVSVLLLFWDGEDGADSGVGAGRVSSLSGEA
jgi:hypothetical protein